MYAQVAFPFYRFQSFTYKIPKSLINKVRKGICVKATFRNKPRIGFIIDITKITTYSGDILDITKLSEEDLSIPEDLWQTLEWISSYYYAPIGPVLKTAVPLSFKETLKPRKMKFVQISSFGLEAVKDLQRAPAQKALLEALLLVDEPVSINSLKFHISNPAGIAKECAKKGFVHITEKSKIHNPLDFIPNLKSEKIKLSSTQENVFTEIVKQLNNNNFSSHYIHGETGSGKTEIYIRLVQEALKQGKSCIILVPEISLTPQTAARFKSHLGSKIALWHSRLTPAEKAWTWKKIKAGDFQIIIGARSALFTPFKNLGLIIIDEEHDYSYKQEKLVPF